MYGAIASVARSELGAAMTRANTAGLAAMLLALVLGVAVWPAAGSTRAFWVQQDTAAIVQVATGPLSEPTLGLVGRNVYGQDAIQLYGYLNAVADLGPADLFAGNARAVGTARFTYVGEIAIASSENRADTTTTAGTGTLRIYFAPNGGATWNDPATFSAGDQVAEYAVDVRETLQRQAPGIGVAVGDGGVTQTIANEFSIGHEQFQFGLLNIVQRMRYVGASITAADGGSGLTIALTGSVSVTERPAIIARVGDPNSVASPVVQSASCAGLGPWLTQTEATLAQAREAGSAVPADAKIDTLDAEAVSQAASAVTALVESQRVIAVPDGAADANRLAVTALSTYARGLQAVADAASKHDAELLDLGQIALQDGSSLLGRAEEGVTGLAAGCP
jgi:hypothetical protein